MLTELCRCSQVVPLGNKNREDEHGVLSNTHLKE